MASYIRTSSIEKFTNPDLEKYQQMDLFFSLEEPDFIPIMEPGSPESVVSEAQSSVSTVMEDLDSIFDEVISTASPPSSPPAAQHQNEGPFFQTTNPTFDDIQPTLQQVYQDVIEPQEEIVSKVEPLEENFVINDFPMADESEATIVKVANVPNVEKSRRGRARAPAAERAARKRNSNKESSRRYRQKIKSRQNDLLSSLDQLTEKKRAIEMDLAKTKAVNSFLVDQLREKFGPLMSRF